MIVTFAGFRFDCEARHLRRGSTSIPVSPLGCRLLEFLLHNRPAAVSKEEIHEQLWPGHYMTDANVANLISDLRLALRDDRRSIIRTIHRFGYAFGAETTEVLVPEAARSNLRASRNPRPLRR